MSVAKAKRSARRQLGQFLTPADVADRLVSNLALDRTSRVLEPSFGDGSFVLPLVELLVQQWEGTTEERLAKVLEENLFGIEIDPRLYERCLDRIVDRWGSLPVNHHLQCGDFFRHEFPFERRTSGGDSLLLPVAFTHIVGNPPFGGTFDPEIEDDLDRRYGWWEGRKLKKETYSFFIVRSVRLLRPGGQIRFICSDSFLTINTMRALRRMLLDQGGVAIEPLARFSDETTYPMVVLDFRATGSSGHLVVDGTRLSRRVIESTDNFSWGMRQDLAAYFEGPRLSDYFIATSGMTIGKNELFLRKIIAGTKIVEPYRFQFYERPITVEGELERARLNKLSSKQTAAVRARQERGDTERCVRAVCREVEATIELPHPDYLFYNKGCSRIVYSPPTDVIFWRDDGAAVLTFKKTGNWYLRGVGGQKFFGFEGLTWQLVSSRLNLRYLPPGYILDSGAPCAFLRPGVQDDELYFVLGWGLTARCTEILKTVINHTQNIQSKDFERLPYPWWVDVRRKRRAVELSRRMVTEAVQGRRFERRDAELEQLEELYRLP